MADYEQLWKEARAREIDWSDMVDKWRTIADQLGEAIETIERQFPSPYVLDTCAAALAAYEEARRPISTVTSTGDAE